MQQRRVTSRPVRDGGECARREFHLIFRVRVAMKRYVTFHPFVPALTFQSLKDLIYHGLPSYFSSLGGWDGEEFYILASLLARTVLSA